MSQPSEIWPEIYALKRKVKTLSGDEPTYVYAPYSLSVYGGYRSIHISWEHKNSSKAVRTEIWTSTTPVREEASMVGRVEGQTFAVHDLEPLQLWHVWIRTVNVAIESGGEFTQVSDWVGPETATTKAVELEDFPEIIIEESILAPLLNEKIQKIDLLDESMYRVAESLVELLVEVRKGDVNLAEVIVDTKTTLEEGVRAEAEARQLVVARIDTDIGDVEAYVGRVDSALVDETEARANAIETVQAQLGSGFSAVQTVSQAVANVNGTVNALWTVKVDANGKVAGIGLVSDGTVTEFAIRADRFFMLTDNATGQQQQVFQIANGQLVFFGDIFAATMTKDGLMTGGNIVGNKIWAQSAINLNNGGQLIIGTGGILSVGTSAYISATRAAFNVSQFFIQSGTPGSSGGSTPFYVSGGVVYMNMAMIKAASITDAMIANAAITNAKIQDLAVTNAKLANATIESAKIKDGAITNAKIANAAIDAAKIQDASITSAKIGYAAIASAHIQDLSVDRLKVKGGFSYGLTNHYGHFTELTAYSSGSIVVLCNVSVDAESGAKVLVTGHVTVMIPKGATALIGLAMNNNYGSSYSWIAKCVLATGADSPQQTDIRCGYLAAVRDIDSATSFQMVIEGMGGEVIAEPRGLSAIVFYK